jgi:FkbM family methyltransferase
MDIAMFSINPSPRMTHYLVTGTPILAQDPVVVVDLGARWGYNDEWRVFGDCLRVICFEPDEAAFAELQLAADPNVTTIPWAIGGATGPATLYEAKLGASTSLYRTDMAYFGRLLNRDNGIVVAEHAVEVHTLDEALATHGVARVDFIKLDVEGAELDVLAGSPRIMACPSLLGVLSEIRFHREINGSPPFSALDSLLSEHGFRIYDLQFHHQSRAVLPYPGLRDYFLPSGERFFAYTRHGQIQDGDALYFRDPLIAANAERARALSPSSLLKLSAFLEIYSLGDCAAELILAERHRLDPIVDCGHLLNLLASGMAGCDITYEDYVRGYFAPPPPAPAPEVAAASPPPPRLSLLNRLVRRLAGL